MNFNIFLSRIYIYIILVWIDTVIVYCKKTLISNICERNRSIFFYEKKKKEAVYVKLWLGFRGGKSFS